jgi:hypothetical protein
MRKTLIALMLLMIVVASCEDNQVNPSTDKISDPVVSKFLNSREFSVRKSLLEKFGRVDFDQTVLNYVAVENTNYATLLIPITKGGRVVAQLQVVDLIAATYLPNEETYAMNLINLMDYSVSNGTGKVKMIDLNYENYEHSVIDFANNKVTAWKYNQLPEKLSLKYTNLRKTKTGLANAKGGGVSCDPNKDGNIGFFECTACVKDAIAQSPTSDFICDVPVAGWVGCFASVTAACIVISAVY